MRARLLEVLDSVAHFLHTPTMAGKRVARARWHHHIHLIPGWLLKLVCDRHDRNIWAQFDDGAEDAAYAALAASQTPEEVAERRAIARRRPPSWAEED